MRSLPANLCMVEMPQATTVVLPPNSSADTQPQRDLKTLFKKERLAGIGEAKEYEEII